MSGEDGVKDGLVLVCFCGETSRTPRHNPVCWNPLCDEYLKPVIPEGGDDSDLSV